VAAQQIGENVAYINWVILTGLAVGSFAAVVLARFRTTATKGFLAFTAFCSAGAGFLAYLSDTALPVPTAGSPITADPSFDQPRQLALLAFSGLALGYSVILSRGGRAPVVAGLALGAGAIAIVAGAIGWGGGLPTAIPLLIQLVVLTLATGGVFAAMILGQQHAGDGHLAAADMGVRVDGARHHDPALDVVGLISLGIRSGRNDLAVLDIDVANIAADLVGGIVNFAASELDEH